MGPRLLVALAATTIAYACSCSFGPICERVPGDSIIVLGEVIAGGAKPGEDTWKVTTPTIRLRVREIFRGLPAGTTEILIKSWFEPGMCAPMPYILGEQTLAILRRDSKGNLFDGLCTASFLAKDAPEDVDYVRRYFAGETTTTIRGRAHQYLDYGTPVPGVEVIANSGTQEFRASSGSDGRFEIANVPPGRYTLRATATGYAAVEKIPPVFVANRACADRSIEMQPQNRIQGQLLDPDRHPISGIAIFLRDPKSKEKFGKEVRPDAEGRFRFSLITPGVYELYVSPFGVEALSPVPKTIYPSPLMVAAETKLDDIEFVIPSPLPTRKVRIHLTAPDGTPAEGHTVRCQEIGGSAVPSWAIPDGTSKPDGVATCTILANRPYTVQLTQTGFRPKITLANPLQVDLPPGANDAVLHFRFSIADFERIKANAPH